LKIGGSPYSIITVSQLFTEDEAGNLSRMVDNDLIARLATVDPWLCPKLTALANEINRKRLPVYGKQILSVTSGALLVRGEKHLSVIYKKMVAEQLRAEIGPAPAYQTRIRDGVYRPDKETFHAAYKVLEMPSIPSKTKEIAFDVLNCIVWTNNKAFKYGKDVTAVEPWKPWNTSFTSASTTLPSNGKSSATSSPKLYARRREECAPPLNTHPH